MQNNPTYTVGDYEITRVREMALDGFAPATLFPNWGELSASEQSEALTPDTVDRANGTLLMSVHSWLVRGNGRTILVDCGVGNGKHRLGVTYFDGKQSPFLSNLAAAGASPTEIDHVLLTHLHVDHVGWNTQLQDGRWVPTFARARHIFSRKEHAFFTDPVNRNDKTQMSFLAQADSVVPVVEAGLANQITIDGTAPLDDFAFHPTPGHSPDHASIILTSRGKTAIFPGDVFHHPAEVAAPELYSCYDPDPDRARQSRRWVLDLAADASAPVFSSHCPASSAGRVHRHGRGYTWTFV